MAKSNIHLITGNDDTQIALAADALFREYAGDDPDPFASDVITVKEGEQPAAALAQLVNSVMTPSFLGGTKTVWLKHFPAFDDEGTAKSESVTGKALHALADRLKNGLPEGVVLIMDGPGCDKKKSFWKTCQSVADVREFSKLDMKNRDWKESMAGIIRDAAQRHALNLDFAVVDALVDMLGCNSDAVDGELEKLACYCGEGVVPTVADVEAICTACGEEQAWALNDCLGKRDLRAALAATENMVSCDKDPGGRARGLLFSVANIFHDMLNIIVFMAENKLRSGRDLKSFLERQSEETKKKYRAEKNAVGMMHPYRAMLLADQVVRYTPHEMIRAIVAIRDAMWQTTSSEINPVVALENALIKICG